MAGRILIVDRDEETRTYLTGALASAGYQTLVANDCVGAMFLLGTEQPGLVILGDCEPDAVNRIRMLSNVPIIVLITGSARSGVDSLNRGADYYVAKPPSIRELEAKIRASFRRWPAVGTPLTG